MSSHLHPDPPISESSHHDARPPKQIAQMVQKLGVSKAETSAVTLLFLAILAGAFISMGALFFTVVTTNSGLGFGTTRLIGGLCFCLGLIMVVIAGAELFTGNNLIAMAWASGLIGTRRVLRNWGIVYVGNVIGCLATVVLVQWADLASLDGGAVGVTALKIASTKAQLGFGEAFARGILCNALVCMAVWMTLGGRNVTDKFLGVILPITAFVAIGLEHSIANWYFLPYGMLLDPTGAVPMAGVASNLVAVTLGNIIGGTLLVAGVYWMAYMRDGRRHPRLPTWGNPMSDEAWSENHHDTDSLAEVNR